MGDRTRVGIGGAATGALARRHGTGSYAKKDGSQNTLGGNKPLRHTERPTQDHDAPSPPLLDGDDPAKHLASVAAWADSYRHTTAGGSRRRSTPSTPEMTRPPAATSTGAATVGSRTASGRPWRTLRVLSSLLGNSGHRKNQSVEADPEPLSGVRRPTSSSTRARAHPKGRQPPKYAICRAIAEP
ncbi:hypothetical protein VTK73DRAFT_5460 [Phialemonium thermophilum]|uniref:Uncharacterized protein n=1 Tax=Phialemonium thermophilum TaxID=223376 RepID=A0ABR3V250_9PEZI